MAANSFVHRRPFPALALAGAGLLAALAGCDNSGGASGSSAVQAANNRPAAEQAPATPEKAAEAAQPAETAQPDAGAKASEPAANGLPQISFDNRFHDFGVITDTEKVRATFAFRNTGDGKLVINEVKAGCGCTVPSLDKYDYMPGEAGEIAIVFDPKGRNGKSTKYVTVKSNSKVENVLQLRFAAEVAPLVSLDRFLQLGTIPLGQEHKATVTATYHDPDLKFTDVSVNDDHITAKLLEEGVVEDSSSGQPTYRTTIELTVHDDMPWGTLYAKRLSMKVQGRVSPEAEPIDYDYSVYIQGNVYGKLEASTASRGRAASPTSTISLSSLPAGQPFEASLQLTRNDGQPFKVTGTSIDSESSFGGAQVRAEQVDTNTWSITVFGDPGKYQGSVRGTVHVMTDVPGEENLSIRYAGRIK